MSKWKIAGINFDHLHMGDNLRMAFEHADVEIVGICDEQPERMKQACEDFAIPADRVFTDYRACLEEDSAGHRPFVPSYRRTRGVDRKGRALRGAYHHGKTLRRHPRRGGPDAAGHGGNGQAVGDQLAAGLVSAAPHGATAHCRRRDRRSDRSPLLRRQPRAPVAPRRQSGAHRRRRRARKAHELVLQKVSGRWLACWTT